MTGNVGHRRSVHLLSAPLAAERPLCPHELYLPYFSNRPPSWETAPISVSICSPSQFVTCMGNRTDFCIDLLAFTILSPAWETTPISVRVITTSVSLTAERPFRLQGTHVVPIPFGSHSQSSTSVAKTVRLRGTNTDYRTWETSLVFFLYLPPSIGLLLPVRSRFFCTRYRV